MKLVDLSAACKLTGLRPTTVRMWEKRYGWPSPSRNQTGYRMFNEIQMEEMRRVAVLVASGTSIGDLVRGGELRLPRDPTQRAKQTTSFVTLERIRLPKFKNALIIRARIIDGFRTRNAPAILQQVYQLPLVHPDDRAKLIRVLHAGVYVCGNRIDAEPFAMFADVRRAVEQLPLQCDTGTYPPEITVNAPTLLTMRSRGGSWAAYRDSDPSSDTFGRYKYLRVGDGSTFLHPPERHPDPSGHVNWRFVFVGSVELDTGIVYDPSDLSQFTT